MKFNLFKIISFTLLAITVTSCGGATPTMNVPKLSPALEGLVAQAKADLAERPSIAESEIQLVQVEEVVWRDSSLGCPQPDMAYAQVLTPGYLIMLEVNGQSYEYHASQTSVVYCENPEPPAPVTPDDI